MDQVESAEDVEASIGLRFNVFENLPEEESPAHLGTQSVVINQSVHIKRFLTIDDDVTLVDRFQLLYEAREGIYLILLLKYRQEVLDILILVLASN